MSLYFISFYEFWKPSVLAQLDKTHLKWSNSSIWNKEKTTLLKSWGWKHAPSKLKLNHTLFSLWMSSQVVHMCKHTTWKDEWVFNKRKEGHVHCTSLLSCLLLELLAPDITWLQADMPKCVCASELFRIFFFFKRNPWELQLEFTFPPKLGCYKFYYKQTKSKAKNKTESAAL